MSDMRNHNRKLQGRARARGVSLIELLVAVTIGGLLIFGATKVYVDSRATYEVNETAARLQETARYALSVMEPDLRMSNYRGLVKGAGMVVDQARRAMALRAPRSCGNNYAQDMKPIWKPATTPTPSVARPVREDGQVLSSDTVTVRRAANTISAAPGPDDCEFVPRVSSPAW